MITAPVLIGLLAGLAIGGLAAFVWVLVWRARYTRAIRRDAVERSLAVTTGKVVEQLVPYLPDFGFNPRDARFLGSPVDFVVFDGLDQGALRRVVFVEVKTGGSDLTARERLIRDVIQAGRVEWAVKRH
ncbi:MAG TPA: Holliday junction resolvase-like protein [Gemmatimonadales bacterium]|nr:Holliday junction resolvase-like protein [Gemmatimonadales bacterium]